MSRFTLVALLVLGAAVALSACASHAIRYKNAQIPAGGVHHEQKQSFFLWGLAGGDEIDLERLCPSGVAAIESRSSAVDSILTWLTAGLYSPMSVDVECAGAGGASARADGGGR